LEGKQLVMGGRRGREWVQYVGRNGIQDEREGMRDGVNEDASERR
jgi:hypothetical protein